MCTLSTMGKIFVLLADEHSNVREQLVARLLREPDISIVNVATNSAQTIEYALKHRPDIILIDPMMQDGAGLKTMKLIKKQLPDTKIVVLTAYVDTSFGIDLKQIGVDQALTKGISSKDLVTTLRNLTSSPILGTSPGVG